MKTHRSHPTFMVPIMIILVVFQQIGHSRFPIGVDAQKTTPKAHFVFAHGSFEGAWIWYEVATLLQEKGFQTTTVDLVSAGRDPTSADSVSSLEQYATPLTKILSNVTGKVILVGHSFGGSSISLEMEYFPVKINKGVFLSAIMPKNGESVATIYPPSLTAGLVAEGGIVEVYGNSSNPSQVTSFGIGPNSTSFLDVFFTISPPKDITLTLSLVKATPLAPVIANLTLTEANYGSVPRYYIRTGKDEAVPPAVQSLTIAANPPTTVFSLDDADHASFFSQPVELVNLLTYIAAL